MRRNFDKVKEACNAQADSINGRVESVEICINAICIENTPARNDQMHETSSNGQFLWSETHVWLALKRAMVKTTETWSTLTVNMFLKRETVARATTKRLVFFHTLFYGIMLANFESEDV